MTTDRVVTPPPGERLPDCPTCGQRPARFSVPLLQFFITHPITAEPCNHTHTPDQWPALVAYMAALAPPGWSDDK